MIIYAIDDCSAQLTYYHGMFGAKVFTNYEKLMACMREQKPQLFICDLIMPVMDGWRVIESVRELYPDLPIIVATASYGKENQFLADVWNCDFWGKDDYTKLKGLVKKWTTYKN